MLNVEKWYAEDWNEMTSPAFNDVLDICNNWLVAHSYTPITEQNAKEKLIDHDATLYPYPYCRIYHIMEVLIVQCTKKTYMETAKTYLNNIDYVPVDHGAKAGESCDYVISKLNRYIDAPNDLGITASEIRRKTK